MYGKCWFGIKDLSCLNPVENGRKRGIGLASYVAVIVPTLHAVLARKNNFA